jgi:hypothetical protein
MTHLTKKVTLALLGLGLLVNTYAADGDFNLTGTIQTQGEMSFKDDDKVLDKFWLRANFGGKYSSENFDAQINIRMFAPNFGNTIEEKNYDKITADVYWANYKWVLGGDKLNLKLGHWKTDWSEGGNFGTYIDAALKNRGLLARDYAHDAFELGWTRGISNLNVMLATTSNTFSTGYVRVEENVKFSFPLELKAAYRVNAIDAMTKPAVQTHRVAAKAVYSIMKDLKVYGEVGFLKTGENSVVDSASIANAIAVAPEYDQGSTYLPFYVGVNIPTAGILDGLMLEAEYLKNRDEITKDADDFAYTISLIKKLGKAKAQLNIYSGNELKAEEVTVALRITTTIK